MADVAGFLGKGGMCKLLDQIRPVGLVHVVATETIGPAQRLTMVGIDKLFVLQIMTFHTQLLLRFSLVELEFQLGRIPVLVHGVTGIATSIQGGMPTPLSRYIQTDCMTFQTEILGLAARKRFQRVILVWRHVWIMALGTVARRRRMQTLAGNGLFVLMTLKAKGTNRSSLQFDAGCVLGDPNLMAGKTADSDCRMNGFPLRLFFVTLQAFVPVRILFQRGRMLGSLKGQNAAGRP